MHRVDPRVVAHQRRPFARRPRARRSNHPADSSPACAEPGAARAPARQLRTLRNYERRGLLAEPARRPGGHRVYPPAAPTVTPMSAACVTVPHIRAPTIADRTRCGQVGPPGRCRGPRRCLALRLSTQARPRRRPPTAPPPESQIGPRFGYLRSSLLFADPQCV
ncbi:MerR family DNA-binding transcriptional regulator [Catellatospora sp. NPDC049111]|uniref:MerR family DNA-binding transcriptional regulator n=1 Tax=Catellatospora sp. NPDC049111 TaxID=3155271 RepID=UPI0033FB04DB